jgi:hypothetical protein
MAAEAEMEGNLSEELLLDSHRGCRFLKIGPSVLLRRYYSSLSFSEGLEIYLQNHKKVISVGRIIYTSQNFPCQGMPSIKDNSGEAMPDVEE